MRFLAEFLDRLKVKYLGESYWAYDNGGIYEVIGYDRELDAWGVVAKNGEAYAVGEDDLEEVAVD